MPQTYCPTVGRKGFSYVRADEGEDWREIDDVAHRRRIQNRLAQRKYREKMQHIKHSPEPSPDLPPTPPSYDPQQQTTFLELPNSLDQANGFSQSYLQHLPDLSSYSSQHRSSFQSEYTLSSSSPWSGGLDTTLFPEPNYYDTVHGVDAALQFFRESSLGDDNDAASSPDMSIHRCPSTCDVKPNISFADFAKHGEGRRRYHVATDGEGFSLNVKGLNQQEVSLLIGCLGGME